MNSSATCESLQRTETRPTNPSAEELRPIRLRRFLVAALLFVLLFGGSIAAGLSGLEDRLVAKRFGVVIPESFYRSGQISQFMLEPTLTSYGIKAVVDLNGLNPDDPLQRNEIATTEKLGVSLYRFKLDGDGQGNIEHYVQALKTIEACRHRGERVLVHCSAGTQRTGGVVAAYRLLVQHEAPATVVNEMRRYGWRPRKDTVLIDYLNEHMAFVAKRLHEEGVIASIPEPLPVLSADVR